MHWLEKFRRGCMNRYGGKGISREELAEMVSLDSGKCSARLIEILELGGITHPNIADEIAAIAGASARQRDSLVHKSRRGTWEPPGKAKRLKAETLVPVLNDPAMKERKVCSFARPVVKLAEDGSEMTRYRSVSRAAEDMGCTTKEIRVRCERRIGTRRGEHATYGCTWRYADEWDAMSKLARMADMERTLRK